MDILGHAVETALEGGPAELRRAHEDAVVAMHQIVEAQTKLKAAVSTMRKLCDHAVLVKQGAAGRTGNCLVCGESGFSDADSLVVSTQDFDDAAPEWLER